MKWNYEQKANTDSDANDVNDIIMLRLLIIFIDSRLVCAAKLIGHRSTHGRYVHAEVAHQFQLDFKLVILILCNSTKWAKLSCGLINNHVFVIFSFGVSYVCAL